MCVGYEGILVEAEGQGIVRTGVLRVGNREHVIGLACVPEAEVGDRVIAHSGHAVRVVDSQSLDVGERSGVRLESEALVDEGGAGMAHLVDLQGGSVETSG